MATKTQAPREKLTLRDSVDLLVAVNQYVEEHVDEMELNGGALPDDLAAMLDEIEAAQKDRVDAIAKKIDEFSGNAAAAKATEDRAARRRRVNENTIKALKAYATLQTQRAGGRLEGTIAVFRMQRNGGAPAVELMMPPESENEALVSIYDAECERVATDAEASGYGVGELTHNVKPHPLAPFITVKRVATLDRKALGAAYEARRAELEREAALIGESDIPWLNGQRPPEATPVEIATALAHMRLHYIRDALFAEFPGVICERGQHLRID